MHINFQTQFIIVDSYFSCVNCIFPEFFEMWIICLVLVISQFYTCFGYYSCQGINQRSVNTKEIITLR